MNSKSPWDRVTKTQPYEAGLVPTPKRFFMSLRDITWWMRSARTDMKLAQFKRDPETPQAFDSLYESVPDPWGSNLQPYRYQQQKYDTLLSLLPARRYRNALDVGCGLGVFTRKLSPHVENVLGTDLSQVAVAQAQQLSHVHNNASFVQADVRGLDQRLNRRFDLVVVADVLYYLSPISDDLMQALLQTIENLVEPGGILLLSNHYFFRFDPDSRMTRRIHDAFLQSGTLRPLHEQKHPFYLSTLFSKEAV